MAQVLGASWSHKLKLTGIVAVAALIATLSTNALTDGSPSMKTVQVADMFAMLSARSPGSRTSAELAAAKLKRSKKPRSYVASRSRKAARPVRFVGLRKSSAPSVVDMIRASAFPDPRLIDSPALVAALGFPVESLLNLPANPLPTTSISSGGGGSALVGGGGGTGAPTGGGADVVVAPVPVSPDVVSAVPEPEAWALMLLGFGAIGSVLRKRRRSSHADRLITGCRRLS